MHPAVFAHHAWWAQHGYGQGHRHGHGPEHGHGAEHGHGYPGGPWQRHHSCSANSGSCSPGGGGGGDGGQSDDDGGGGWNFGVRRPLRFLAHKLDLDERQVGAFAKILDDLKTERAQAEVDRRRTVSAFADALTSDSFDQDRARQGGALRLQSAERLADAVVGALAKIYEVLNQEQRGRLAYLIRTGTLTL